jgi:hypothetical protein
VVRGNEDFSVSIEKTVSPPLSSVSLHEAADSRWPTTTREIEGETAPTEASFAKL